ncbi:MerR family transcriptional regulator [Bifidobacterium aquikefiri]|uniref:MerR family transcriptional regulator n=1 Tax=Bifidobacterium aquikefiri TaxID=1653207 RepID=UPI0023EF6361|nr:MerR family transcriptional regulator [Bifidobacterium aquikefiri]
MSIPSESDLAAKAKLLDVPASQVIPDKSIGEVRALTALSIDTLRYYEKIGLIDHIARDASGHRIYSDLDVERIRFVRRLRATGMPVSQIIHYVQLRAQGPNTADSRLHMLLDHRERLIRMQQELDDSVKLVDGKILYYRHLIEQKDTGHATTR